MGEVVKNIPVGIIFILAAVSAFAQCVHRNDVLLNKLSQGMGGAKVYMCQQPFSGAPCGNQILIYTDLTCTATLPQPIVADAQGNFDVYAESQWVTVQVVYGYSAPTIYRDYGLFTVGGTSNGGYPNSEDFSVDIPSPALTDSGAYHHKVDHKAGVVRISCSTDQGTATIDLDMRAEATPNTPGTPVIGNNGLGCISATTNVATFFMNALVPQNSVLTPLVSNIQGSPTTLNIHVSVEPQ